MTLATATNAAPVCKLLPWHIDTDFSTQRIPWVVNSDLHLTLCNFLLSSKYAVQTKKKEFCFLLSCCHASRTFLRLLEYNVIWSPFQAQFNYCKYCFFLTGDCFNVEEVEIPIITKLGKEKIQQEIKLFLNVADKKCTNSMYSMHDFYLFFRLFLGE